MSTAIAKANTTPSSIVDGYSSIQGDDFDTRKRVYAAVSNAESLSDHLGKSLSIKDIIVQPVTSDPDEETGEVDEYLRTTLIDVDGVAYAAGSNGVALSVRNILSIMGEPGTWAEPLAIKAIEKPSSKGKGWKFITLELA